VSWVLAFQIYASSGHVAIPLSDFLDDFSSIPAEMGNRRPLGEINNVVGARPYPCAIAKKPMLE
jgi:hypothetical protein